MIMEYWSPNPQSFYVPKNYTKPKQATHISVGLGDTDIVQSTILWNLLSVTSRLCFIWESGNVPDDECPATFEHMKQCQADMFRLNHLMLGSFHDFWKHIRDSDVSGLQIAKYHGGLDKLRFVVRSRYLAKYGCETDEDRFVLDVAKRKIWSGAH